MPLPPGSLPPESSVQSILPTSPKPIGFNISDNTTAIQSPRVRALTVFFQLCPLYMSNIIRTFSFYVSRSQLFWVENSLQHFTDEPHSHHLLFTPLSMERSSSNNPTTLICLVSQSPVLEASFATLILIYNPEVPYHFHCFTSPSERVQQPSPRAAVIPSCPPSVLMALQLSTACSQNGCLVNAAYCSWLGSASQTALTKPNQVEDPYANCEGLSLLQFQAHFS